MKESCHITKYTGCIFIKKPSPRVHPLNEFTTIKGLIPSLTDTELVMTVPKGSWNLGMLIHIIQTHKKLKDIHQNVNALIHFEKDNSKWNKRQYTLSQQES